MLVSWEGEGWGGRSRVRGLKKGSTTTTHTKPHKHEPTRVRRKDTQTRTQSNALLLTPPRDEAHKSSNRSPFFRFEASPPPPSLCFQRSNCRLSFYVSPTPAHHALHHNRLRVHVLEPDDGAERMRHTLETAKIEGVSEAVKLKHNFPSSAHSQNDSHPRPAHPTLPTHRQPG